MNPTRDDATYILDTFPIVRRKDEEKHGHYRTQRVILKIYDALAAAQHTGQSYTVSEPQNRPLWGAHGVACDECRTSP